MMKKIFLIGHISIILSFFLVGVAVQAAGSGGALKSDNANDMAIKTQSFGDSGGFNAGASAAEIVSVVIKAFLGLLGVIFVSLIVTAGYKYMTANGDEGKVEESLAGIKRAVIGLIIIVAAYSITAFVFKNLPDSASGGNSNPVGGSQ